MGVKSWYYNAAAGMANTKCTIVYSYAEESGPGSSPSVEAFPFTDEGLLQAFVEDWNRENIDGGLEKDGENIYRGTGDWCYWL
jgi:hypothetical protein